MKKPVVINNRRKVSQTAHALDRQAGPLEITRSVSVAPADYANAGIVPGHAKGLPLLVHRIRSYFIKKWVTSLVAKSDIHDYWSEHDINRLLSLGDPQFINFHISRLNIKLRTARQARAWLALMGVDGLELIKQSVHAHNLKAGRKALIKVAERVLTPETAVYLLEILLTGEAVTDCKHWFKANPKLTAAGLLPIAAGEDSDTAKAAISVLRELVEAGQEDIVRAHLERLPEEAFQRLSPGILSNLKNADNNQTE